MVCEKTLLLDLLLFFSGVAIVLGYVRGSEEIERNKPTTTREGF